MSKNSKREQVGAQCNAVVHQAGAIAAVYADLAKAFHADLDDEQMLDMIGRRSADLMELLGDVINGMDAVTDEDKWLDPVFEQAHAMFPQPQAGSSAP